MIDSMKKSEKEIIIELLTQKISPQFIILFGSLANGNARAESDCDIAFISLQRHSDYHVFMVAQELAGILERDVDLVDLSKASTVFQAQVIVKGETVYSGDEHERMLFAMTVLKKYARLNEERRCILEKIAGRGSVYA